MNEPRARRTLHQIVRANDPEHDPHRKGEPSPGGIMHEGWCGKLIPDTASHNLARASRHHVLNPLATRP